MECQQATPPYSIISLITLKLRMTATNYRVSLCSVYFLQCLQYLLTSSRTGLGLLLTPIE